MPSVALLVLRNKGNELACSRTTSLGVLSSPVRTPKVGPNLNGLSLTTSDGIHVTRSQGVIIIAKRKALFTDKLPSIRAQPNEF